jgi:hypothetical protein
MDRDFALTRSIRSLGGSDCKLRLADAFQYSSNCIGHPIIPWEFLKRQMIIKETGVLYHAGPRWQASVEVPAKKSMLACPRTRSCEAAKAKSPTNPGIFHLLRTLGGIELSRR